MGKSGENAIEQLRLHKLDFSEIWADSRTGTARRARAIAGQISQSAHIVRRDDAIDGDVLRLSRRRDD